MQEHTSTLLAPSPEEVPVLAHLIHKELTARELMQVNGTIMPLTLIFHCYLWLVGCYTSGAFRFPYKTM